MTTRPTTGGGKFKKVGEAFSWLGSVYWPYSDAEWQAKKNTDPDKLARVNLSFRAWGLTGFFIVAFLVGGNRWKPSNVAEIFLPERLMYEGGRKLNGAAKGSVVKVEDWNSQLNTSSETETARQQIK